MSATEQPADTAADREPGLPMPGPPEDERPPFWQSPKAELGLYALAALAPWFILNAQHEIRYGDDPSILWPWWSLMTLVVVAAFLALAVLPFRAGRVTRVLPGLVLGGRDPQKLALWGVAAMLGAGLLVPMFAEFHRQLVFNPVWPTRADMLLFVELSLREFWRDSVFPYHTFELGHWYAGATYPPFLWLQFTVPWMFNVDPRVWTVASLAILCMAFFLYAGLGAAASRSTVARAGLLVPLALPFLMFYLPAFEELRFNVHTAGLWMFAGLLALAVRTRSWIAAGVLLALCVTSRAWFLFAIPPMLVYCFFNLREMTWRGIARFWGSLVITGLVIGGPFLAWRPRFFLDQLLSSYDRFQPLTIARDPGIIQGFGLSGILHALELQDHMLKLAVGVQALLFALAVWRLRTERDAVRFMALNVLFFTLFAIIPYYYIFVPPLVMMAFVGPAVTMAERNALENLPERAVRPARWVFGGACLAILFFATLGAMFARPDRHETEVDGMQAPLVTETAYLISGFYRSGWVQNTDFTEHQIGDRHAYLSIEVTNPNHDHIYIEYEVDNAPEGGGWAQVLINGEEFGAIDLSSEGRFDRTMQIPKKNYKFGPNLLQIHVGGRYGEGPSHEDVKAMGFSLRKVVALQ